VEKYRPLNIDDCVLPKGLIKTFREFVKNNEIPNLLLCGSAGVGKTTIARALCEQLDSDYILINGSEESGIDVLRNKIKNFASTVSLTGGRKVVILDEADYLNPQSTQPALRGFIEEFSKNCRFIFTCNFANRIISPLHSRCSVIEFKIPKQETPEVARNFMVRVQNILEQEGVEYDPKVIVELITKYIPDWRRVLNELQRYSAGGTIDVGILSSSADIHIDEVLDCIKTKNFTKLRKWVVNNMDNDPHVVFRKVYDRLDDVLTPAGVSQAVVIIAEYGYKSAFVVDQEINTVACLTEILHRCEFA
jgi:DNA polymerase III delta prime subunit